MKKQNAFVFQEKIWPPTIYDILMNYWLDVKRIMQNNIWLKHPLTSTQGLYVAKFLSEIF